MNVRLTPEHARIIEDQLKTGRFRTPEEVIGEALQALREKEASSSPVPSSQSAAVREMLTYVEQNRVRLEGVSVKDLIREGHRL
jgi:hypothetical protein